MNKQHKMNIRHKPKKKIKKYQNGETKQRHA